MGSLGTSIALLDSRHVNILIQSLKEFSLFPISSLSWSAPDDQTSLVFAAVFVIFWCGAGIVTLNGALLGGNM
jgi:hypothetical protein